MSTVDEDVARALCWGIIRHGQPPMAEFYAEGQRCHADGLGFHECNYDDRTPEALSWRIGWNDAALKESD